MQKRFLEEFKMKTLLLSLTFVSLTVAVQAVNGQSSETEVYISNRRQALEDYYTGRLAELRLLAQANIRMLEIAEKPKSNCIGLDEWAKFAETILLINGYENQPYGLFEPADKTAAERLAIALSRITERKSDILADLEWQTIKLERQKNYALTAGLEKLEKRLKANLQKTEPEKTTGIIVGIIYSSDEPVAIIDDTVVHQTQTINGAKVVKIYTDRVEFEKNGRTWTQQIREVQEDYWK
jgi:hypothetical protein